jgi:hypothetical protein
MPYKIEGLAEALKALRKISPELYKEMNKEILPVMTHMRDQARSFIPENISGLSSWSNHTNATSRTSRARAFPQYDQTAARKGIVYSRGRQRNNNTGWVSLYSLLNRNAIGAIIETAGRKSGFKPASDSQSNNKTNNHFTTAIDSTVGEMVQYGSGNKTRGRIIFRAAYEDQGKAKRSIEYALNKTLTKLQGKMGIKV